MMKLTAKEVKDMVMKGIKLPDNMVVGENLYLSDTQIESIPDNMVVNGFLDLESTPIKSLPNNLVVRGNLYLSDTQIGMIPDDLSVKGLIDARGSNVYCTDCISSKIDPKKVITDQ